MRQLFQNLARFFKKKPKPSRQKLAGYVQSHSLRLEVSSKCQLKCPLCITGTGFNRKHSPVSWGHLRLQDFQKLLDDNPQVRDLELSNYGEILLNPELIPMLRLAHQKNVRLTALNGLNLNHLSEEQAEALVRYRFEKMKISIDGASPESYAIYRVGGDFWKVIRNIERINHYKAKFKSKYPKLKWQFIVFGHNEHEIEKAQAMATSLGMGFKIKLNYKPKKFPIQNPQKLRKLLGAANIAEYEKKAQKLYSPACLQMWTHPQINWDGKLLGCCVNHFGDFGNVFEQGLDSCLRSERFTYAKKMLLGQKAPREDIPCTHCKRFARVQTMRLEDDLLKHLTENP